MARTLRDKINAIVTDAYDLRRESSITLIENLIKEELRLQEEERVLTYIDLLSINSNAINEFTHMNVGPEALGKISGDQSLIRTLCIFNSIISFLRNKKLLTSVIKYDPKK